MRGKIRKSTTPPLYRTFDINDTIDNADGLTITVRMQRDDT